MQTQAVLYTVQPGDSLSAISKKLFGDFSMTAELAKLNSISNPNIIHPGQQLIIPDKPTTNITDAVVVSNSSSSFKVWIGKAFPWIVVAVAAVLLGREAMKQNKKNKKAVKA